MQTFKPDLELKDLNQFSGTENYYRVLGVNCTDGVKYLMDTGYAWVVTDAIIRIKWDLRKEEFVLVKLQIDQFHQASIVYEDGNGNQFFTQRYAFTDAKVEVKLFFRDNVLMLPGEY